MAIDNPFATATVDDVKLVNAWDIAADRLDYDRQQLEIAADPVTWIKEILGESPWSKQQEIARSVRDNRRTAVQSCHDVGKSFIASRIVAWWIAAHPPGEAFVVTSAPTFQQVRAILWREIGRAHAKGNLIGSTTETEWKIGKELVGFGRKPSDYSPTAFQGIHARYVLVVLDEACGIPESLGDAADTLITNDSSSILAVREVLVSPTWVEEKRKKWSENHPFWQSKVLGLFPQQSATALLPLNDLLEATRREYKPKEDDPRILGVDVARFGIDKTVFVLREGGRGRVVYNVNGSDTMETAKKVQSYMRRHKANIAAVDTVGVGGGVYDRLVEEDENVISMQAASRAKDYMTYGNARAEWYWTFREMLEAGEVDLDPDDEESIEQLAGLQFKIDNRGRIMVESKEDMKKRGLESPDRADAFALAFGRNDDQDWGSAYGVSSCKSCNRSFVDSGQTACPYCHSKIG